jgi:hypothetical protein
MAIEPYFLQVVEEKETANGKPRNSKQITNNDAR